MHASSFAIAAHGDQLYGTLPYAAHLAEVVSILMNEMVVGEYSALIDAGWLHDVVEDTKTHAYAIEANFGSRVGDIVKLLTDPDLPTRSERKAEFCRRMGGITVETRDVIRCEALTVKTADRVANIRAGVRESNVKKLEMYVAEHGSFIDLFTSGFSCYENGPVARRLYTEAIASALTHLALLDT